MTVPANLTAPLLATGFAVDAVIFDGTNDEMNRGGGLTGAADGKQGLVSAWINFQGGDGALQQIFSNTGGFFEFRKSADNTLRVAAADALGNGILQINSSTTYTAASGWLPIAASWNLATGATHLFVGGVDVEAAGAVATDENIDYTRADWFFGNWDVSSARLNAFAAEMYFTTTYLDISIPANLRRLRSSGRKPANPGASGALVTGTSPLVYFSVRPGQVASVFATNRGTGGDFAITGALAIAPSSPSD